MKKRIWLLILAVALLCSLASCAPDYSADSRIGTYTDKETGCYTLVLGADGKGSITHTSSTVLPTSEDIFFEIREDTLYLNGKLANGGVIGQNEYFGKITESEDGYTVALQSDVTGIVLGTFTKKK